MYNNEELLYHTFESVRVASGYSLEEAAQGIGITPEQLQEIEENPEKTPAYIVIAMKHFYGFQFELVYIGSKEEAFKHNKNVARNAALRRREGQRL